MHEHSPAQASKIDSFFFPDDYVMLCYLYHIILRCVCVMPFSGKTEIRNQSVIDGAYSYSAYPTF